MFTPNEFGVSREVTTADWEASSSLAEDPFLHDRTDMHQDMDVFETDALHGTHLAPIDTHGDGAVRKKQLRGHDGRIVLFPYRGRLGIGTYGIYVGNWSGRRRLSWVNVVARCPAQIMLPQQVDHRFVHTLRDPPTIGEARSAPD